jgi:hypothetical protein
MLLDPPLALLLGVAGGVLQYAVRQFDRMPEWVYHAAAVALCFALYVVVTPGWASGGWREVVINAVTWLAERVPTVWGGTFMVSNAAKLVSARSAGSQRSLAVPLTNSK